MRNVAEPRRESSIAIAALVIACISLLGPRAASAAAGGWEFEITPYLWLSEVHGSVSAKNRTANIDIDFSDIFDALGAGDLLNLAGHFEARHEKLALFYDADGILARDQNGGPDFNAKVKSMLVFFEFGGAYRIIGQPPSVGATGLGSFWLEPLFGVRYTHNKNKFDVRVGQETTDFDGTTNFADPFLGGRLGFQIIKDLGWSFRGDVAPFGTGAEPGAWQIQSYFRYLLPWTENCSVKWDVIAGYRLLHFDRKPGNRVEADYTFRGPVIGFSARF